MSPDAAEEEVKHGRKKAPEAKLGIRESARAETRNFLDLGKQSIEVLRSVWYTNGEIKSYLSNDWMFLRFLSCLERRKLLFFISWLNFGVLFWLKIICYSELSNVINCFFNYHGYVRKLSWVGKLFCEIDGLLIFEWQLEKWKKSNKLFVFFHSP